MRRLTPTTIALIVGGLLLLGVAVLFLARSGRSNPDRLGDNQLAAADGSDPGERCASQRTYDSIKRELFRQAAEMRGSDRSVFDKLSAYAAVRMERPVMKSEDGDIGTIRCSGRLSLDLPPGVAVVGGRRTLSADIDYVLQAAADGSGDVVVLEGADAIVVPLATLGRSGAGQPAPVPVPSPPTPGADPLPPASAPVPDIGPPPPGTPVPPPPPAPPAAPEAVPQASASPSFNCRYARTRGEVAVCNDAGLAALDRQMASQFYRSVASGDARQRELLRSTRSRFLRYRDSCRSDACIADAYRGRIAEIRDIMAGRWNPPR